jgi:hypothetical protein
MRSKTIKSKDISWAAKVAAYMECLYEVDEQRYQEATGKTIPFGDLAYGMALRDWHNAGCPKDSFFSYSQGEVPCPLLMAFRKEISEHFGLPILTIEEGELKLKEFKKRGTKVITHKVQDWGLN